MNSKINRSDIHVAILAGGQGTRFWPISRKDQPKQFLSISKSGESLIQATVRRVRPLIEPDALSVVTNVAHIPLIKEHIPDSNIIIEPVGRNTAAAIGLAAIYSQVNSGSDPVLICLPADHAVGNEDKLRLVLETAVETAQRLDCLITIGIKPSAPNTAYGYIKRGASLAQDVYKVSRFYEKPNTERAQKYFESGDYFWNSGMFVWRASVILNAIKTYMPELYEGLEKIKAEIGKENESRLVAEVFDSIESISIDFGVLEHATNCLVVTGVDFGWNDVGSWDAWAEHFQKDQQGNLIRGDALLIDSQECVVYSKKRFTAVLGASDLVVIDSGDALLVCPRSRVQDVKKIVVELEAKAREDLI